MRNILGRLWTYLRESRRELQRVDWPSRPEVVRLTVAVIVFSVAVAMVLGGFDFIFDRAVLQLIPR